MMASSTMANPASNPMPTCTVFSARTTGTPRPPAPTSAAITTIDRLSMMHWVMPAMMVGAAQGNSTFHSSCMGVAPKASPASRSACGTEETPRCVRRIGAGRAKMIVEIRPGTTPRPNSTRVGIRYTKVGSVCIRSSTGRSAWYKRGRCAAAMPIGTPIRVDKHGGHQHQRQSLERREPVALIHDEQQRQDDEHGQLDRTAQHPGQARQCGDQQRGRNGHQRRRHAIDAAANGRWRSH